MVQLIVKIFMHGASNILWNSSDWNGFFNILNSRKAWSSFRRRHFQMHFHNKKCMNFDFIFTEVFFLMTHLTKTAASVQKIVWCRRGDRPLSDSMMSQSIDAYMCHPVLNELINPTQHKQSTRCAIIQHSLFLCEASFTNISFWEYGMDY